MRLILTTLLFFSLTCAMAAPVAVSSATVAASQQTPQDLQRDLGKAYRQVLIKMTGNPGVVTLPAVRESMNQVQRYVLSYHYQKNTNTFIQEPWLLQASFDAKALKTFLSQNNQAIWPSERPDTTVWLLQQTKAGTTIALPTDPVVKQLAYLAAQRGVPLFFPEASSDEQQAVQKITALKAQPFTDWSSTYRAPSLLVLRVQQTADSAQVNWLWQYRGNVVNWQSEGDTLGGALQQGVNQIANQMASDLALLSNANTQQQITITVDNLSGIDQMAAMMKLLRNLSSVNSVQLQSTSGDSAVFAVNILGDVSQLQQALNQSADLQALAVTPHDNIILDSDTNPAPPVTNLNYRWLSSADG